ncbi:DUF4058 family protein [Tautonia plasticadhaerens]|uniref:DUF4058 domain-containing protein n=1 Tax=Tautonia plasticadhaerens TaxID=2527974 RepID=A0A518GUH9_9BACT|nr:DUF4058 family protein [Tautonia plasticadhaerens]QDV32245.1 hypothetical protein ElP_00680 [Tautonia plasticadhaerens]
MPGPFPGMDPYLEDHDLWPGLHQGFMTFLWSALNEGLPDRYVANLNERLYIDDPNRAIVPDAAVFERSSPGGRPWGNPGAAGAAVLDPPWLVDWPAEEIREGFVEILPAREPDRVVAVIELLSPSNKAAGSTGRASYQAKQAEILGSPAHLIEIDLLRDGEHTVAVSRHQLARRGRYHYLTCLNRGSGPRWRSEVWARTIRDRLPRIAVPLLDDDPDLVLDLQPLLDRCYDAGAYGRRIDYAAEPVPPLTRADAEWVDALLREEGRRG